MGQNGFGDRGSDGAAGVSQKRVVVGDRLSRARVHRASASTTGDVQEALEDSWKIQRADADPR